MKFNQSIHNANWRRNIVYKTREILFAKTEKYMCVCTIRVSKTRVCQPLWRNRLSEHCRTLFSRLSSFLLPPLFSLFFILLYCPTSFSKLSFYCHSSEVFWGVSQVKWFNGWSFRQPIISKGLPFANSPRELLLDSGKSVTDWQSEIHASLSKNQQARVSVWKFSPRWSQNLFS